MKAPTDLIERKPKRTGELRVKLVMMREELEGARFAQTVHPGDRRHADRMLDEGFEYGEDGCGARGWGQLGESSQ